MQQLLQSVFDGDRGEEVHGNHQPDQQLQRELAHPAGAQPQLFEDGIDRCGWDDAGEQLRADLEREWLGRVDGTCRKLHSRCLLGRCRVEYLKQTRRHLAGVTQCQILI